MINGNISGISNQLLERLEELQEMTVPREDFLDPEIVRIITELTEKVRREISIYLNRRGEILDISVGELNQVALIPMRLRRSMDRLSGIRCIHTHPGGSGMLSKVDLNALSELKFDAIAALGVSEGAFTEGYVALLNPLGEDQAYKVHGPLSIEDLCGPALIQEIRHHDILIGVPMTVDTMAEGEERAVLIGLDDHGEGILSMIELEELAKTAGAKVLQKTIQSRKRPDPATYIGRGKAAELSLTCQALSANLVVCDDELSAAQIKNLEEILGLKVIDRTTLILDIFSKRASSREGKMQVELAQLKYRLPRLMGMGHTLSRLGGGIGTRGPGEKKLESDRRHIRRTIHEIEEALKKVKERRSALRERRNKEGTPICALVGYTNTGKSTLLNVLTGSNVLAEDMLFATLDPVSRGLMLPNNQEVLLIDTVGFVDKLPHDLVDAFHATLEEVVNADLLLHVVDAGSTALQEHMMVVQRVLNQLGATQPILTIYNKMDTVADPSLLPTIKDSTNISALKGHGLDSLLARIQENLPARIRRLELLIPYEEGQIRSMIHNHGQVVTEEFVQEGITMEVMVDEPLYARINKAFIKNSINND